MASERLGEASRPSGRDFSVKLLGDVASALGRRFSTSVLFV